MQRFASIAAFVTFMNRRQAEVHAARKHGLEAAGRMFVVECKALIGQELDSWAPLAAATVLEKERLGYTGRVSATDPLLRRGDLSLSFSYTLRGDRKMAFGSDDLVMVFHEIGTVKMPPRPIVGPVTAQHGKEGAEIVANYMAGALAGRSGPLKPLPPGKHDGE